MSDNTVTGKLCSEELQDCTAVQMIFGRSHREG